jgi:hypothetical protein
MSKWLVGRVVVIDAKENPMHYQMLRLAELNNIKFLPIQVTLTSLVYARRDIAAKAWDSFRLSFIRKVEDALSLGCDSVEIFRALIVSTSNVDTGNCPSSTPSYSSSLRIHTHTFLTWNLNSLLACDVLLRQLDQSFAQGADGFSLGINSTPEMAMYFV